MIETLRQLSDQQCVVAIPDKTTTIKALNRYSDLTRRCTESSDTRYAALLNCFKLGLKSISDDMQAIVQLGTTNAIIKNNTQKLLASSVEFIEPLSQVARQKLLNHREHASQVLSEEAPTAAYLLYSQNHHYVSVARAFRNSVTQTSTVLLFLNRLIQLIDCKDPDIELIDIIATELAIQPPPALADYRQAGKVGHRVLSGILSGLSDDSRVGTPVERWIHFDQDIEIAALDVELLPSLLRWNTAIQRCLTDLEHHQANGEHQHCSPLIDSVSQEIADRLICVVNLIAAQRMMCTHLHNLVLQQFKVVSQYYETLVTDLQQIVDDYTQILSRVTTTLTALQS